MSSDTLSFAMIANTSNEESELLDAAIAWLQAKLPANWTVARSNRVVPGRKPGDPQIPIDGVIDIGSNQGGTIAMAVEVKRSFQPRDVERVLPGISRVLRNLSSNIPLLVVAPWLSGRTRELLVNDGINYVDLAGNARVSLEYPPLFLQTEGAERDPSPTDRPAARVRGPKAGRLVRLLVDVSPPYGVKDIAQVTQLNPGYVSRLLETLDREAVVDRSSRGQVTSVDIPRIIQRWAQSYDVFKSNATTTFLSPPGAAQAFKQLAESRSGGRIAVTGSFAAVRRAPVAAPAMLLAFCDDPAAVAESLKLLPADSGANVALLTPFDEVVWERTTVENGITYVADSQAAIDCLTGNGRMPSEGDALIAWMVENQSRWRVSSLANLDRDIES
jgi:hypothetical protein